MDYFKDLVIKVHELIYTKDKRKLYTDILISNYLLMHEMRLENDSRRAINIFFVNKVPKELERKNTICTIRFEEEWKDFNEFKLKGLIEEGMKEITRPVEGSITTGIFYDNILGSDPKDTIKKMMLNLV